MGISQLPEPLDGIGRGPEIPALEGSDEVLLGASDERPALGHDQGFQL